jgi:hypothetical protein
VSEHRSGYGGNGEQESSERERSRFGGRRRPQDQGGGAGRQQWDESPSYEPGGSADPQDWQRYGGQRERQGREQFGGPGSRRPSSGWEPESPGYGFERESGGYGQFGRSGDFGRGYEGDFGRGYEGGSSYGQRYQGAGQGREGGFAGRGPKGYRRSDGRVLEDVSQALEEDPRIDASNIEVSCDGGEVVLKGSVPDRRTKRLAEDCVEGMPGVKDVRNELRIGSQQTPGAGERS